jgi:hypothetical protein
MRIFKNDLTHYFIRPHDQLPQGYLKSCRKFFKSLKCPQAQESCHPDGWPAGNKQQASSDKFQASSNKILLHKPGTRVKNRFNRKV